MAKATSSSALCRGKIIAAFSFLCVMACALFGCGTSSSSASDVPDRSSESNSQVIVSMPTTAEPAAGFDPMFNWGFGEHVHEPLIQSTLIKTDTNLSFQNDLATDYACAPDGMSWTFTIRDDVRFSDGSPLTAHDVAFTINGIINSAASEADLSSVKEARAESDTVVTFAMNYPNNALLYTLAVIGIVPRDSYGEGYGAAPIGSGRYMVERWDKGQQVILVPNPYYYGEAPHIERVVIVFMEEDASLAAAQAGQVDIAYTSALHAEHEPENYYLLVCRSVDSRGISLPSVPREEAPKTIEGASYVVGNNVTCDVAIRRALNYGIDREQMIANVLAGYGTPAYSVSDGMPWYSPDMAVETDVGKANALLEEAGWVFGGGNETGGEGAIRAKDGLEASFDLYYPINDPVRQALAAEFANQARTLGIKVEIKGANWEDIYPHQYSDPVLWGWGSNSPIELYELTYSGGWGNYAGYADPDVDASLQAALAQPSIEDSYRYYQQAQWNKDTHTGVAPQGASTWVWLANIDHLYFARNGLQVADQKPHPHGHGWSLVNNIDEWTWDKA